MKVIKILDYYPFIKDDAEQELFEKFKWQKYPQKHFESRFTKFYEAYWTPRKFKFDKRRAYFSSLILTNQMSRKDALLKIKSSPLSDDEMREEFRYIANKLDWSVEEFEEIFKGENKSFRDYKNNLKLIQFCTKLANFLKLDNRIFR